MEDIPVIDCYHVAVYLGKERVAHIGSSKFVKASKIKENKALLGARVDDWQEFLKNKEEKATNKKSYYQEFILEGKTPKTDILIRYHSIIPFKKPELIQEQIKKAILA